jgi:hypothetical protein
MATGRKAFLEELAEEMTQCVEVDFLANHACLIAHSVRVKGETFGELKNRAATIFRGYLHIYNFLNPRQPKDPHTAKVLMRRVFGQDKDW